MPTPSPAPGHPPRLPALIVALALAAAACSPSTPATSGDEPVPVTSTRPDPRGPRDPRRPGPSPSTPTPTTLPAPAPSPTDEWELPPPPPTVAPDVTPIYLTIFSHNERTATRYDRYATDPAGYATWRAAMIEVARLLHDRGVRYSWQTDYLMVDAIERYEADALAADPGPTGGLPLLTYFADELGVSIEPHAHECVDPPLRGDCTREPYDYADVAARIEQVSGITPAPVIGGTSEAERSLDDFTSCIGGNVFAVPWCPRILTGFAGTTGGHTTDDHHSGVWRPSGFDAAGFLTDDPDGVIANVGRGYSLGAFGAFGGASIDPLTFITGLAERLRTGEAPPGRIYTATVNFNEDTLIENDLLDDIASVLDTLQPLVDEGRVVYANFPEVVAAWEDRYDAEPNIYAYEP